MSLLRFSFLLFISALMNACVTINVYFPAAAAEKAADKIIDRVWGEEANKSEQNAPPAENKPQTPPPNENKPQNPTPEKSSQFQWLDLFISRAHATEVDVDVSSPAIKALNQKMAARHKQLLEHYNSGGIGLTNNGFISLHDTAAIPLKARNTVNRAIEEENDDRKALYREIAEANGHPEWESDIQNTFAKRWIQRAQRGWWYQNNAGQWVQK